MDKKHISDITPDFSDIAPYDDAQFVHKMASLVKEPGFEHAVRFVLPGVDYQAFCAHLLTLRSVRDFQLTVMRDFLSGLIARTTDGVTASGIENVSADGSYTYLSNHRDIVLDASFLNYCLMTHDRPLSQVAIGNNLLIMDWIEDLVRINGSFIVKRDVKRLEALDAAKHLSQYIHHAVAEGHSVWIAQREGRAKDSNDLTQGALIKMLSIGGGSDVRQSLAEINILPVAISYEYDPNDYLKVREFVLKRLDPDYKKTQHDDLLSMETGLLQFKGRIHFHFGKCVSQDILDGPDQRNVVISHACALIDNEIHSGYRFYPINYIAYDRLEKTLRFRDKYTTEDIDKFDEYMQGQLGKVDLPDIDDTQRHMMEQDFLTMYANPLRNHLRTKGVLDS